MFQIPILKGTKAQYALVTTPDASTLYIITDASDEGDTTVYLGTISLAKIGGNVSTEDAIDTDSTDDDGKIANIGAIKAFVSSALTIGTFGEDE